MSTEAELRKFAGSGVYYHVSYYGVPLSYLWVTSTPLSLMQEEMTKAYYAGSDDCWILNVGDLKPSEIPMEFFLSMGWDIDRYSDKEIPDFLAKVMKRDFGFSDAGAAEAAAIVEQYYQLAIAKRPERTRGASTA